MTESHVRALISKYANGIANPEEVRQLMDWYQTNANQDVPWPADSKEEKEIFHERILSKLQEQIQSKKVRKITFIPIKAAAIFLIFVGVASLLIYFLKPSSENYVTINNPARQVRLITLPDSSKVWLNASGLLQYAQNFNEQRKVILQGEAFFNVTHDPLHPFSIEAGGLTTSVLGTSFNINAYQSDTTTAVTVLSGKVKVEDESKTRDVLTAGRQLVFDRKRNSIQNNLIDTADVAAWRNGSLRFQGKTLAEIASALEHWYNIEISFNDPRIRYCRYYLNFESQISLEKLLEAVHQLTGLDYQYDRDLHTVKLLGSGCQ